MTSLGRKLFGKFLGMTIATSSLLACGPTKSLQNATGTKDEAIIGGELVVRPEGAIVGGDVVQPLDPRTNHIASATVLVKNLGKTKNDTCTGTIVSKSVILTAAHCVSDHMRIYFGNSITAGSESRLVTVALENSIFAAKTKEMMRAESPEQWEQIRNHGDIALLKIEGEIPDSAQIAQLLTNKAHLKNGKEVILAGFGTYDAIKNLSDKRLRMAKVKIEDSHFAETEILLNQLDGVGACNGDSGGPAFVERLGSLYLWGVTSRSYEDVFGDCSKYSVYTSIVPYLSYIREGIKYLEQTTARP